MRLVLINLQQGEALHHRRSIAQRKPIFPQKCEYPVGRRDKITVVDTACIQNFQGPVRREDTYDGQFKSRQDTFGGYWRPIQNRKVDYPEATLGDHH